MRETETKADTTFRLSARNAVGKTVRLLKRTAENPRIETLIPEFFFLAYAGIPFWMRIPAYAVGLKEDDDGRAKISLAVAAVMFCFAVFLMKGEVLQATLGAAGYVAVQTLKTKIVRKFGRIGCLGEALSAVFIVLMVNDPMQSSTATAFCLLFPKAGESTSMLKTRAVLLMTAAVFLIMTGLGSALKRKTAVRSASFLIFMLGTANFFVLSITKKPFLPSDLKKAGTALGVMNGVSVEAETLVRYAGCLALFAIFFVLAPKLVGRNRGGKRKARAVLFAVGLGIIFHVTATKDSYLQYYANYNYEYLTSLLIEPSDSLKKPPDADEWGSVDEILEEETVYGEEFSDGKPNVLVIMSEAWCDFSSIGNLETDVDPIPNAGRLMKECPSGTVYSSVWGNNTVSSEASFLTGIPTCLSASGAEIFKNSEGKSLRSIVSVMKDAGYGTIGMHPYLRNGYYRADAWNAFGFDETEFLESFSDAETVRGYVSDAALFDEAAEKLEATDEPLFLFAVTMQNHATYGEGTDPPVKATSFEGEKDLENYLSLVRKSDEALGNFIERIEETGEPTVLMFFGDHQPMLGKGTYEGLFGKKSSEFDDADVRKEYAVPYFIWTNAGIDGDVPKETDMSRLPAILLRFVGIRDPWFEYVLGTADDFPVLTDNFFKAGGEWCRKDLKNILKRKEEGSEAFSELSRYRKYCWELLTRDFAKGGIEP